MEKKKWLELRAALLALTCGAGMLTGCSSTNAYKDVEQILPITSLGNVDGVDFCSLDSVSNDKANEIVRTEGMSSVYENFFEDFEYDLSCSPVEFQSYLNYGELDWNDIRDALNTNSNIDDDLKKRLLKGVDNLEVRNFRISLPILYYNLSNLKTDYLEEDYNNGLTFITANFDCFTQTVHINKKIIGHETFENILFHEVFGHGSTCAYRVTDDGKRIWCGLDIPSCLFKDGKPICFSLVGKCVSEASAEIIRSAAQGKRIKNFDTSYTFDVYNLLFLCDAVDVSVNDVFMNGSKFLHSKAIENNVPDALSMLFNIDFFYINYFENQNSSYPFNVNDFYISYLDNYVDMQSKNGLSDGEIGENAHSMLFGYEAFLEPSISENGEKCLYADMYKMNQTLFPETIYSAVVEKHKTLNLTK